MRNRAISGDPRAWLNVSKAHSGCVVTAKARADMTTGTPHGMLIMACSMGALQDRCLADAIGGICGPVLLTLSTVCGHADGKLGILESQAQHVEGMHTRPDLKTRLPAGQLQNHSHARVQKRLHAQQ